MRDVDVRGRVDGLEIVEARLRADAVRLDDGDDLRRQVERSQEWANRNGYLLDVSLYLQDLGVSAFKGRHRDAGQLRAFIDAVE